MIDRRTLLGLAQPRCSPVRDPMAPSSGKPSFPSRAGSSTRSAARSRASIPRSRQGAGSTTLFPRCSKDWFITIRIFLSRWPRSQLTTTFHRTRRSSPSICAVIALLAEIGSRTPIRLAWRYPRGISAPPDGVAAQWSDGTPITAEDFVYAWRRFVDPETAAPMGYQSYSIANAEEVNNGKCDPRKLGVRALGDFILHVELRAPLRSSSTSSLNTCSPQFPGGVLKPHKNGGSSRPGRHPETSLRVARSLFPITGDTSNWSRFGIPTTTKPLSSE